MIHIFRFVRSSSLRLATIKNGITVVLFSLILCNDSKMPIHLILQFVYSFLRPCVLELLFFFPFREMSWSVCDLNYIPFIGQQTWVEIVIAVENIKKKPFQTKHLRLLSWRQSHTSIFANRKLIPRIYWNEWMKAFVYSEFRNCKFSMNYLVIS